MTKPYLEFRTRNSFGDIINLYFEFLKHNFKTYTNLYLKYNAFSALLALIASYLLVTGFMGLASRDFRFGMSEGINNESYLLMGLAVLLLTIFVTFFLNNSFSSSYVATYVEGEGKVDPRIVWRKILDRIGVLILLVFIGGGIYIAQLIVAGILTFIPLIGMFLQYGIGFTVSAFIGLTFISLFVNTDSIGAALSEGWNFTFDNFWKVILFGFIIGILNMLIAVLILSIPTFIIGIYSYFSLQSEVDLATSVVANIIYTVGFAAFILGFIYTQALSQIAFSILYFNLHEDRYNVYLRERIEQIGTTDPVIE